VLWEESGAPILVSRQMVAIFETRPHEPPSPPPLASLLT
jgi:hypothetical protein